MTVKELVVSLFAALIAALITDVFADWSARVSKWLARCAAARLHSEACDRYAEEWIETLTTRPRLLQLLFALDLFRATYIINREHRARMAYSELGARYERGHFTKRAIDIVFALIVLLFISPLFLAIAIIVKFSSPGPILFKQRRYTLNGEEVLVYKFRTVEVAEDDVCKDVARRPTPIGHFLRRTSLDELPQVINVLEGKMSFVGPRPHALAHNEMYKALLKGTKMANRVLPGLTGWAQINGLRGETGTIDQLIRRVRFALDYIQNRSLWLDMKIFVATALRVLYRSTNVSTTKKRFRGSLIQHVLEMLRRLLRRTGGKSEKRD